MPSADRRCASSNQLVGFGDPGTSPATQPVVEDDAGRLATFAHSGAVLDLEPRRKRTVFSASASAAWTEIEGRIDHPRSGEKVQMGLAGIDDSFELGVRQQIGDAHIGSIGR